jgi:xylan 1,4-beta-xylosidase
MYSSYTAAAFARKYDLAAGRGLNLLGAVTWAFEFENQPYFDGFRELATNGLDKPVLNTFRMFGLMGGERIQAESSGAVELKTMLETGVKDEPDINALASRSQRAVTVLVWNYHDDDLPSPAAEVCASVKGLPAGAERVLLRHYRIDHSHSNSYALWQEMGSPNEPTPAQYAQLEAAGQLELLTSPEWLRPADGEVEIEFPLPRQGVSLLELSW